jgi:adenylate kinase family enzyme
MLGMPGAGKSTAARRIGTALSAPVWSSGDVVRATMQSRGLRRTAQNDRRIAEEFARDPGSIGRQLAQTVKRSGSDVAIVEGFRTTADLAAFRRAFPAATVVAVEVGTERRHSRMLNRGRVGEDNRAFLRDRDRSEVRRGVRNAMRQANMRVRPRGETMVSLDRSLARMLGRVDPNLAQRFRAATKESP